MSPARSALIVYRLGQGILNPQSGVQLPVGAPIYQVCITEGVKEFRAGLKASGDNTGDNTNADNGDVFGLCGPALFARSFAPRNRFTG